MGLTIYFRFEFEGNEEEVKDKLLKVRDKAKELGFAKVEDELWRVDYSRKDKREKTDKGYRWAKIQYELLDETKEEARKYKGYIINLWAGPGCEPTNIGLVSKDGVHWIGEAFTKTQYAENFLRCHLLVIFILDYIEELGFLKEVCDEGEFWETRDLNRLADNINASTALIMSVLETLRDVGHKIKSPIDECENFMIVEKEIKKERSNRNIGR